MKRAARLLLLLAIGWALSATAPGQAVVAAGGEVVAARTALILDGLRADWASVVDS